jgi:AcrR family transcriptional regulator
MMVLQNVSDPFERLKAMGKVYVNFALENEDFYDLMFVIKAPLNILEDEECWMEGQRAFDILIDVVKDCIETNRFEGHDAEELSFVIWSTLHGIVTLIYRGRCRVITEEKRENIQEKGLEVFVRLLDKC